MKLTADQRRVLLFVVAGCEYNLGPTVNVTNTNTNTNNTNIIDLHDLVNFAPVANPTAPLPNPSGGKDTPLAIPAGSRPSRRRSRRIIAALLAQSCQSVYGESGWAVPGRTGPRRWRRRTRAGATLSKRIPGTISQDVIAYRATADNPARGGGRYRGSLRRVVVRVERAGTGRESAMERDAFLTKGKN